MNIVLAFTSASSLALLAVAVGRMIRMPKLWLGVWICFACGFFLGWIS